MAGVVLEEGCRPGAVILNATGGNLREERSAEHHGVCSNFSRAKRSLVGRKYKEREGRRNFIFVAVSLPSY